VTSGKVFKSTKLQFDNSLFAHQKSDEMYVDERLRRCPRCEAVKGLSNFQPKADNSCKPRRDPEGRVTWLCQSCRGEEWKMAKEIKQAELGQAKAQACRELVKAVSSATRRTQLEEAAPTPGGGMRRLIKAAGGEDAFWDASGESLIDIVKNGEPGDKLTAIRAVMSFSVNTAKLQGTPVDLSSLSDDDLFMLLLEPARQLLLENADFRTELLNDPEVRRVLLEDAGVDLIEV